jgi:hypothetical protein
MWLAELFALGMGNLFGSFFSSYPTSGRQPQNLSLSDERLSMSCRVGPVYLSMKVHIYIVCKYGRT